MFTYKAAEEFLIACRVGIRKLRFDVGKTLERFFDMRAINHVCNGAGHKKSQTTLRCDLAPACTLLGSFLPVTAAELFNATLGVDEGRLPCVKRVAL